MTCQEGFGTSATMRTTPGGDSKCYSKKQACLLTPKNPTPLEIQETTQKPSTSQLHRLVQICKIKTDKVVEKVFGRCKS